MCACVMCTRPSTIVLIRTCTAELACTRRARNLREIDARRWAHTHGPPWGVGFALQSWRRAWRLGCTVPVTRLTAGRAMA